MKAKETGQKEEIHITNTGQGHTEKQGTRMEIIGFGKIRKIEIFHNIHIKNVLYKKGVH